MRAKLVALLAVAACRSPAPVSWQEPVEIARGGGTKGPWQQNDSRFDYVDDPSVALADDGSAAVVWVDHRDKDVHFTRFAVDGTRSTAVNVSRTPAVFSWLPRIVVAGEEVYVVWQEIIFSGGSHGGDILFARSRDRGATFDTPLNLSRSIGGDGKARIDAKTWHNGSLDLVRAPNGTLHVAWTEYDGALWFTSSTDAQTFTTPAQVAGTQARPARAPSLAASATALYLAWTVGEDDAADIHVARRSGDTFGEPLVVARTPTYSDAPKLVLAGDTLHIAYAESTGGPFDKARVVYTQMQDGRFAPPRTLGDGGFPSLAVDGHRVVVVWEAPDHRGLVAAYSTGDAFSRPTQVVGTRDPAGGINGSHQGRLMRKLAVARGQVVIANSALAHGKASRVWLVRGRIE